MFVRITPDDGWVGWLGSFLGYKPEEIVEVYHSRYIEDIDLDEITEDNIVSNTIVIDIPTDKIEEMKNSMTEIKLGLTLNGTDTTSLSQEVLEMLEMRGAHISLVDYYISNKGFQYRCSMSSREKNETVKQFEIEQKELKILKDMGFYECGDTIFNEVSERGVFSSDEE